MPPGRPKESVPHEMANLIVEWLSEGKTLREFCRQPKTPAFQTVYDWMDKDEDFARRIARARESGEDVIAQECLEIADDGTNDWIERQNKDGSTSVELNSEHVTRSRLRVDTRLKLLAKWNPKKYGDKAHLEVAGTDGGPIQSSVTVTFVKQVTSE